MIQIHTDTFSKLFVSLFRVYTVLGLLFAHWYGISMALYFINDFQDSKWLIPFFILQLTILVSVHRIVYRRKVLARLLFDISDKLRHLDLTAYKSSVKHFKITLAILILFTVIQVTCVTYARYTRDNPNVNWTRRLAFNACSDDTCLQIFHLGDGFAYAIFIYGLISIYNLIYCYMAHAIANCVRALTNKMATNLTKQPELYTLLSFVNRETRQIKNFVRSLNEELQYLVLVWLLVVFVMSCNGLMNLITFTYDGILEIYHLFFINFHLLSLLFLVAFVASRLEKAVEQTRFLLDEMSWVALTQNLTQEVHVIRRNISHGNMMLKAGDCFLITSKLFVSYIGFALTYTVIIIQINPRALNVLQTFFHKN